MVSLHCGRVHGADRAQGGDAGVGHQDVDRAEVGAGLVDEAQGGVEVAHVGHRRHAAPALLLDQAHRLGQIVLGGQRVADTVQVVAEVADGDVGPEPGQLEGVAAALAPGPSGDHRHPARERTVPPRSDAVVRVMVSPPGSLMPWCRRDGGRVVVSSPSRSGLGSGRPLVGAGPRSAAPGGTAGPSGRRHSRSDGPGPSRRGEGSTAGADRPAGGGAPRPTARTRGPGRSGSGGGRASSRSSQSPGAAGPSRRGPTGRRPAPPGPRRASPEYSVTSGSSAGSGRRSRLSGRSQTPSRCSASRARARPAAAGGALLGRPARRGHHHHAPRPVPRAGVARGGSRLWRSWRSSRCPASR